MQKTCEQCGAIGGCEWHDDDEDEDKDEPNMDVIDRNVTRFFTAVIGVCLLGLSLLAVSFFGRHL